MRKFLITLFLIISFAYCSFAQTFKYYSTEFSYKTKNNYGYWSKWSEWESSHCLIVINLDRMVINIYSSTTQEYDIYDFDGGISEDNGGGEYMTLKCVDRDGLRCELRLRVQTDNQIQLYVDYNDVILVYNIRHKN